MFARLWADWCRGIRSRTVPKLHLTLHPVVPYAKFILPPIILAMIIRVTYVDAMVVRMVADGQARDRLLARQQAQSQTGLTINGEAPEVPLHHGKPGERFRRS